ncbi:hypothetical protein AV521_19620 [Streptomyces sp. IMTB 2501]|nr:hypothetical protein AV521_19620 [Streptomyces sp. IMTB 2501]
MGATASCPSSASAAAHPRLVVTHGGTTAHPAVYDGHGRTVAGITVEANHVIVENYRVTRPKAPGIEITGDDITVRNNTVTSPHGGDGDGMRFFGDDLKIQHNTVRGASNPHTFDFTIRDNNCETLKASQALMFEDVQHVTIVHNTFAAPTDHAIGLAIHSTSAPVRGNRTNPRVRYEVGIDASSRPGYRGPKGAALSDRSRPGPAPVRSGLRRREIP